MMVGLGAHTMDASHKISWSNYVKLERVDLLLGTTVYHTSQFSSSLSARLGN